jgi:hypothetical protein
LDLIVCLELAAGKTPHGTYGDLAKAVGLSASEANQAVQRAVRAGLLRPSTSRQEKPGANPEALLEFLEHGVRRAFFVVPGKVMRGMPTAQSAPPLNGLLASDEDTRFVWPDPEGTSRGQSIEPLYETVPATARKNPVLYELLALVDALRCGGARERKLAMAELTRRIRDAART